MQQLAGHLLAVLAVLAVLATRLEEWPLPEMVAQAVVQTEAPVLLEVFQVAVEVPMVVQVPPVAIAVL